MALEFKKLSDVESVEAVAETANVLIEEDGVIKKAPKTQVGGAGGGENYDIVLMIDGSPDRNISTEKISIIEGGMENVRTAAKEGRIPKGKVIFKSGCFVDEYGVYGNYNQASLNFYMYGDYIHAGCLIYNISHSNGQDGVYTHRFVFDSTGNITKTQYTTYQKYES